MRRAAIIAAAFMLAAISTRVEAHPHVLVDAQTEIVFDDNGAITAIRHIWQFDDAFAAYAVQGLDTNNDGQLTRSELVPLAQTNVDSLANYDFFTWLDFDGEAQAFQAPTEYWLDSYHGHLTLFYTLPLQTPATPHSAVLRIYDPEYFVAISFDDGPPITLDNAPPGCSAAFIPPPALDPQTATALAAVPADQRAVPANLAGYTDELANTFVITCDTADAAAAPAAEAAPPAETTAGSGPLGIGAPETGAGNWGGPLAPLFVKIAAWQTSFYRQLTDNLAATRNGASFLWVLLGISFLYGVFHAAGPGHGKAVITSYLLATGETLRRGIVIAFAAAFVQALTAIALVSIASGLLHVTAASMSNATNVLEIGSFAMIVAVGAWLLWTRLRPTPVRRTERTRAKLRPAQATASAAPRDLPLEYFPRSMRGDNAPTRFTADPLPIGMSDVRVLETDDGHDHHHHAADAAQLDRRLTFASAWSAIVAVGIRPCSGAIIVLVFALSQGLYAAGVTSTFVMAIGTGFTVSLLASLAVFARDAMFRITRRRSKALAILGRTVEIGGAVLVILLGLLLLGGALSG